MSLSAKLNAQVLNLPLNGVGAILAHYRVLYKPVFKDGTAIRCKNGSTVAMGEATVLCDSALIEALALATDAPRHASRNGQPGEVKRDGLPGFFKKWAKVAWGDLLLSLPDEDDAEVGCDGATSEQFKQLVREALSSQVVLGDTGDGNHPAQVERRSLIDWCVRFAKAGPWRSIRSFKIWCKTRIADGNEVVLMVAMRHELFSQVKADRRLCQMTAAKFARRAARYGVGSTDRSERPHGHSAVVLNEKFVADLSGFTPEEGRESMAGNLVDSEVPSSGPDLGQIMPDGGQY